MAVVPAEPSHSMGWVNAKKNQSKHCMEIGRVEGDSGRECLQRAAAMLFLKLSMSPLTPSG